MDVGCGYTEIVPFSTESGTLAEICVDIGAPQSALQEFKSSEIAGHFCYQNSDTLNTASSNRFIYWKVNNTIIDFIETSLDKNLIGNRLRLKFQNTPILDGVSVNETQNEIYILIATVSSVFRITLPHPHKLNTTNLAFNFSSFFKNKSNITYLPSIFVNINQENFQNYLHSHILNECYNVGSNNTASIPISSCTWLTDTNDSVFALSNSNSGIYLITMSSFVDGNKVTSNELKQNNLIKRLWNGMMPSIIRTGINKDEICLSMFSYQFMNDYLIFALCKDFKLRVWSYLRQECIIVFNLLEIIAEHEYSLENGDDSKLLTSDLVGNFNLYKSFLRRSKQAEPDQLIFSTFVSSSNLKQFIVFEFSSTANQQNINCIANLCAPEVDLIDFFITPSTIWSMWLNAQGATTIHSASIDKNTNSIWQPVSIRSSYLMDVNLKSVYLTPRELYLDEIFFKGNFNIETITKAFNIYNRNYEHIISESSSLLENVCYSVEHSIRDIVGQNELSTEEYSRIEEQCWEKFFSYCIQYKNIGNKPLGLIYDHRTCFLSLITKDECIFLKSNDNLSDLILNSNVNLDSYLYKNDLDLSLKQDLKQILDYISLIDENLSDSIVVDFELNMSNSNESIDAFFDNAFSEYLLTCNETETGQAFKTIFDDFLNKSNNYETIIELLLKSLDLKNDEFDLDQSIDELPTVVPNNFLNLMSSIDGLSLTCASVHQLARSRFKLCRNLLLLQKILLSQDPKSNVEIIKKIQLFFIPRTVSLLHTYYFLTWVCETTVKIDDNLFLNSEERTSMLSAIGLNEYQNLQFIEKDQNNELRNIRSLLFYFLQCRGLNLSKKIMIAKSNNLHLQTIFKHIFPSLIESILQALWPVSNNFTFPEFLLGIGLYDLLIECVDQLDKWLLWNKSSRQFVKGICFLQTYEPAKALTCLIKSLNKLTSEPFLCKILQLRNDYFNRDNEEFMCAFDPEIVYTFYQKLIRLFDLQTYTDYKIKICKYALSNLQSIEENEQQQYSTAFHSILFIAKLELDDYDSAFNSIQINNSIEQRKNCLRQFIVTLYEKDEMERLTNYSYNELEDDFVSIMESKARSSDISLNLKNNTNSYYELLYSYFIKNHNYRKAASTMYEYSRRLYQEVPGLPSLSKQVLALGMTLNNLRIIDPNYAWIIKPTVKIISNSIRNQDPNKGFISLNKLNTSMNVSKRSFDGNLIIPSSVDYGLQQAIKREIDVLSIEDIRIEYELAKARLSLLEKDSELNSIANSYLHAEEIVNLLISNCMFDFAFKLSLKLNQSILKIFDEMINRYVFCVMNPYRLDELFVAVQNWFTENETAALTYISNSNTNLINKMWLLINEYLTKYEKPKQTQIHKCIVEKLLMTGIPIPYSLKFSYQKRNSSELIFLLISYNCLEEAVDLSLELINGYLGIGTDYFDINFNVMSGEICYFPNQIFNKLLSILEENKDESKACAEMQKQLKTKLDDYKRYATAASERILNC